MTPKVEISKETTLREDLKKVCNLAYQKGIVSGTEGNLSLKISDELILITPRHSHKGSIEASDFLIVDLQGSIISNGSREPTSEIALHLETYKKRKDISAVVHAHPVSVVAFSVANIDFCQPVIPEIIVQLGEVPRVPYSEPSTFKLAELASSYLEKHDAVILDHHGAVTVGKDIYDAYFKMESLEHAAKIMSKALALGELKILDETYIKELIKQRHSLFGKGIELRDGENLFQKTKKPFTFRNILKRLLDSNSSVLQRILCLSNEITLAVLSRTSYSQRLSEEEKEKLSREITSSFLGMIIEKLTHKKM